MGKKIKVGEVYEFFYFYENKIGKFVEMDKEKYVFFSEKPNKIFYTIPENNIIRKIDE